MSRRVTRALRIGRVPVGGGAPVTIQSMCNTPTADAAATLAQIRELAKAGCELIRVAVPDLTAAEALKVITAESPLPVIADVHFDYRLAVAAIANGVAAVRVNPGNLGGEEAVKAVAEAAGAAGVPIRVGANSGSLAQLWRDRIPDRSVDRAGHDEMLGEALAASALEQAALLEKYGFHAIKISPKASSVAVTVAACRKVAERSDYPLHVGVTEAGIPAGGIIKSAVGIGALLLEGIGDTIRVSLTADPLQEVVAARKILESAGLRDAAPELVSCPTCGRTKIDLIGLAEKVEDLIESLKREGRTIRLAKVAVMGCIVNGPGEAKDADLGIAGGQGKVALFRHGEVIGSYSEEEGFERLRAAILAAAD